MEINLHVHQQCYDLTANIYQLENIEATLGPETSSAMGSTTLA